MSQTRPIDPSPSTLRDTLTDRAVCGILAANAATLAVGLHAGWPLAMYVWPFWLQSVLLGAAVVLRVLFSPHLCTARVRINGRRVEPTLGTRATLAGFFVAHYGLFHLAYAAFLYQEVSPLGREDLGLIAAIALPFVASQWQARREQARQGHEPLASAGALLWEPYRRIVPMHLTIAVVSLVPLGLRGGWIPIAGFVLIKATADVLGHRKAERQLGREAAARAGVPMPPAGPSTLARILSSDVRFWKRSPTRRA